MKKPILKGPKLIAVGSLKLFKNGFTSEGSRTARSQSSGGGGGGKGGGSSSSKKSKPKGGSKPKPSPKAQAILDTPQGQSIGYVPGHATQEQAEESGKAHEEALGQKQKQMQGHRDLAGKVLGAGLGFATGSGLLGKAAEKGFGKLAGKVTARDALGGLSGSPSTSGPRKNRSGGPQYGGLGAALGVGAAGLAAHKYATRGGSAPASTPAPVAETKTPSQMTEAELEGMLAKRARGEDSIVDKQAKLARERGLTQQLSSIRGARGATAGQKLRALQRGGSKMGIELGAQTSIAKAQEQQAAQQALLAHKRGDRQAAEKYAHLAGSAQYKYGSGSAPSAGASQQVQQDKFGNILKTGKKIYDVGKGLGSLTGWWEEGGKVEGPGSETSDSISAKLSDGEFVVKASAVRGLGKQLGAKDKEDQRKKGIEFLYKLQDKMDKKVKKFGGGGSVESKNEKLRKRQKLLAKLRAAKIKITIKKPKKKKLSVDDLIDMPFAKGGEAYVRPKKAFREAIGYESESRFHDKAEKDAKFGGARRKFRHFKHGGEASYGDVIAAQKNLNRRLEKLEKRK